MTHAKYMITHSLKAVATAIVLCCTLTACHEKQEPKMQPGTIATCKSTFDKAAKAQNLGDFAKAQALFDKVLQTPMQADKATNDSLQPIVNRALTQMLNTYQSKGDPCGCVSYMTQLSNRKRSVAAAMCKRDIATTLAYAVSRTENVDEAVHMMDSALRIPPVNPTHDRLMRDYGYAAAVYYCQDNRKDDVIKYGNMALDELAYSKNKSGGLWIGALLGMVYKRNGDIRSAIDMFNNCYNNSLITGDSLGMANTCYLTADMLLYWNLAAYANEYASRAVDIIRHIRNTNPMVCSNVLTNKAQIMVDLNHTDSAMYYLDKANIFTRDLPYNSGNSDIELIKGSMLLLKPSTHTQGRQMLVHVAANATTGIKTKAYYTLAKDYLANNDSQHGEQALDSTVALISNSTSPILVNDIYEYALNYYITTGNNAKVLQLANIFNKMSMVTSNSDILRKITENVIKFKMEKREESMRLKQAEMESKSKFMKIYSVAILLLLVCITIILLIRRRFAVLRQQFAEKQLENLTMQLEAIAKDRQLLTEKLKQKNDETTALNATTPQNQATTELQHFSHTKIQDKECETRFRNTFLQVHPLFLERLRDTVPNISPREELLSMLIAMKLDNSQIENIMCIARSSINMARYRLRSKMHLNREESLEEAIANILNRQ